MGWNRQPHGLSNRSVEQLTWLAGLLEGEGYFGETSTPGRKGSPRITVVSTDEDVIDSAAELFNRTKTLAKRNPASPVHWKPLYRVEIAGKQALEMMRILYPYMHSRRKARIDEVIQTYDRKD